MCGETRHAGTVVAQKAGVLDHESLVGVSSNKKRLAALARHCSRHRKPRPGSPPGDQRRVRTAAIRL
jgi:hypothetical protein